MEFPGGSVGIFLEACFYFYFFGGGQSWRAIPANEYQADNLKDPPGETSRSTKKTTNMLHVWNIYLYICLKCMVNLNVGKFSIRGAHGCGESETLP